MAGGGGHGKGAGIALDHTIEAGAFTAMFPAFILTWTPDGETITELGIGLVTGGIMNGFPIGN